MALPQVVFSRQSLRWLFAELVVVVLGILIAFQVEEWRTQISDRRQEKVLLENMLDDFTFNRELLQDYQESLRCQIEDLMQYSDYLESAEQRSKEELEEQSLNCTVYYWAPTSPTYSGWRDLGRPDLISNTEIRGSLNRFYEGLIPFMMTSTEKLQAARDELDRAIRRDWRLTIRGDVNSANYQRTLTLIEPIEALPRASDFYTLSAIWLIWATNLDANITRANQFLDEMELQIRAQLT